MKNPIGKPFTVFLLLFLLPISIFAQEPISEVVYEQGKIIGSLPYGRHFYIIGNNKLPNGADADKVTVEIWNTGFVKVRRNQESRPITSEQLTSVTSNTPIIKTEWLASKAENPAQFKAYINTLLKTRTQYIVRISFFKAFVFELTEEEKNEILLRVTDLAYTQFRRNGELRATELAKFINEQSRVLLYRRLNLSETSFIAGASVTRTDILPEVSFDQNTLRTLTFYLGRLSAKQNLIEENNKTIAFEIKPILDEAEEDSADFADAISEQRSLERQNRKAARERDSLKFALLDDLEVLKNQMLRVSSEFSIVQPDEYSVSELDAVNIGTSFGGAVIGLNPTNVDNREFDAFGYTAIKFHFLPVDKRINDPFLDVFFLNRTSFLIGVSFSNNFNYKGQQLERVLGFFPVVGFSYDMSRYFGIDAGITMFRQNSLSPLTEADQLRIGPLVGLTLDMDLFNRFKTLFSGEQYIVNPTNN